MTTRAFLIIALLVSLALAPGECSGRCLCRRTRATFGNYKNIQDIQIHPPSPYCEKMEIIVFLINKLQYCLDPEVKKVQELITHLQN